MTLFTLEESAHAILREDAVSILSQSGKTNQEAERLVRVRWRENGNTLETLTESNSMVRYLVMRARAWIFEGVRDNRVAVKRDGSVLVYDSIADLFTSNHELSEESMAKAREIAEWENRDKWE